MKKVYFIETNGYNMVVQVDENRECKYLTETEDFPVLTRLETNEKGEAARVFLRELMKGMYGKHIWNDECTYEQLFEEYPGDKLAEIEWGYNYAIKYEGDEENDNAEWYGTFEAAYKEAQESVRGRVANWAEIERYDQDGYIDEDFSYLIGWDEDKSYYEQNECTAGELCIVFFDDLKNERL